MKRLLAALVALIATASAAAAAPTVEWEQVDKRPHDRSAFTEGLVGHGRVLLESTGLQGASSVRRVDPASGRVLRRTANAPALFGEGLTVLNGVAWQLTWTNGRTLGFSPVTLGKRFSRAYPHEGWGLTTDGSALIASDGSSTLRWLDPRTLATRRVVQVTDDGVSVRNLNELEFIDGAIWANVWLTKQIAVIDPGDGHVRAWLDLSPLVPQSGDPDAVANGIAVDPITRLPLVTGKRWPWMYVIRPEAIPA